MGQEHSNSTRDPVRDAKRARGNFTLEKGKIAIVNGLSSFPILKILREQQKEFGGLIVIFEADSLLAEHIVNSGDKTISYCHGKAKNTSYKHFYSNRDPVRDAKRAMGNFTLEKGKIAIVNVCNLRDFLCPSPRISHLPFYRCALNVRTFHPLPTLLHQAHLIYRIRLDRQ